MALSLGACGDDSAPGVTGSSGGTGGTGATGGTGGTGGTNQAPSIGGSPAPMAKQGTEYVFVPTADDPDGDTLTFWVTGLPSWASFDEVSGEISGTPDAGDLGNYSNITVGVTDGAANVLLSAFSVEVVATALGTATLSWEAPTTRSDGTPLADLAGFKIYWGMNQENLSNSRTIDNPGIATYVIDELTPARWYFVATAFDSAGIESSFSNIATKRIF
jgi:hypothetical protein